MGVSETPYLGSDVMILYLQIRGSKVGDLVCISLFSVQEALTGEQAWIRFLDKKLLLSCVQTDATLWANNSQHCWELLRPFVRSFKFDRFQTLGNNTQQHSTTCNRVYKRTQHVITSNKVESCWPTMLRPFTRGFSGLVCFIDCV